VTPETFRFTLNRAKLRVVRRREGRYLLRSNMSAQIRRSSGSFTCNSRRSKKPSKRSKATWPFGDLSSARGSGGGAHLYRLPGLLRAGHAEPGLRDLAPGLTARAVLEKFAAVQMLDVHLPTTDGRTVILTRYTQPEDDLRLLLERLKLELPSQPPPRIEAPKDGAAKADVVQTS